MKSGPIRRVPGCSRAPAARGSPNSGRRASAAVIGLAIGAGLRPHLPAHAWGRLAHRASARVRRVADSLPTRGRRSGPSSSRVNRWPTPRPGPTSTAATYPAVPAWHYVNVPISSPHYYSSDCHGNMRRVAVRRVSPDPGRSPRPSHAGEWPCGTWSTSSQDCASANARGRPPRSGRQRLQLQFYRDEFTNLHQVWDSGLR